jgi:hypothetical protein
MSGEAPDGTPDDTTPSDGQVFVLLGWMWDVTAATCLAARYPVRRVNVGRLAWMLVVINVDPDHAARSDLGRPLLAVPIPSAEAPLVIDGWHRVHHALATGVRELPVIVLDATDERACRLMGGDVTRPG